MASPNSGVRAAADPSSSTSTSGPAQVNTDRSPPDHRDSCPICGHEHNSEYHDDPIITYCGHVFGRACLNAWLREHSPDQVCPRADCGKPQVHGCGHRCAPQSVLGDYPSISPRAEERQLEPRCRGCWATERSEDFRRRDPVYLDVLWALIDLPEAELEATTIDGFCERWTRAVMESRRRWEATGEGRTERW